MAGCGLPHGVRRNAAHVAERNGKPWEIVDKEHTLIAFIRQDDRPAVPPSLRRARRLVASTLLHARRRREERGPRVSAWLAWGFTAWVSVVTLVYGLRMMCWL